MENCLAERSFEPYSWMLSGQVTFLTWPSLVRCFTVVVAVGDVFVDMMYTNFLSRHVVTTKLPAHLSEDRSTEKLKRKNCQSTGRSSIEFDHCFINCIFSVRVGCLEKQLLKSSNYRAYFRNLVTFWLSMRHNVLIVGKVEVGGELHKSFPWNARGNWKVMP